MTSVIDMIGTITGSYGMRLRQYQYRYYAYTLNSMPYRDIATSIIKFSSRDSTLTRSVRVFEY